MKQAFNEDDGQQKISQHVSEKQPCICQEQEVGMTRSQIILEQNRDPKIVPLWQKAVSNDEAQFNAVCFISVMVY